MYDSFAYISKKHKHTIDKILRETRQNKRVKLYDKLKSLKELYQEPIKTHLLFYKLQEGKHSSWKSVLTEFYKLSLDDYNKELSKELPETFTNKETCSNVLKKLSFKLTLKSPFFTASENEFYSIQNPIAKERPTGLPVLKGNSLKGALRQAAVDNIESELLKKNYGGNFEEYANKEIEEIVGLEEKEGNDRFYFKKRSQLVKLFGNEKDTKWFTFKSLLATGGIKDVKKTENILKKINNAFEHYLKKKQIVNSEGVCKGRLIFEDLQFKKVNLDVITPLDRTKRTPVHGPIFYEVVPEGEVIVGKLIWFPFDLIARGEVENLKDEWKTDKELIEKAFEKLSKKGIGAKTKAGWGRFRWEEINES